MNTRRYAELSATLDAKTRNKMNINIMSQARLLNSQKRARLIVLSTSVQYLIGYEKCLWQLTTSGGQATSENASDARARFDRETRNRY